MMKSVRLYNLVIKIHPDMPAQPVGGASQSARSHLLLFNQPNYLLVGDQHLSDMPPIGPDYRLHLKKSHPKTETSNWA